MRRTRTAVVAAAAIAAALPAAAQAVPPTLGPPTSVADPSGQAPPTQHPAPPQPQPSNPTPPSGPVNQPPAQPHPAHPAGKPEPKMLVTAAVRFRGSGFTLRARCSRSGTASLRATGPGSITGLRMGTHPFRCRNGSTTIRARLRGAALRRARRVSAFTVDVTLRGAGATRRETLLVNGARPSRRTARSSAWQTWNSGHGSCQSSGDPYQSGKFTIYVPNFTLPAGHADYYGWQAHILIYTDAGGYRWFSSGWYYWHPVGPQGFYDGPHSHSFWIGAGYDQYIQGAVEYYEYYGKGHDWNYVRTVSNWGGPMYGSWCYFP